MFVVTVPETFARLSCSLSGLVVLVVLQVDISIAVEELNLS